MDRKVRNSIAWLVVLGIMFVTAAACHAQDATFNAKGDITLTKGALDAFRGAVREELTKGVNVNVKPSGLGGVQQGITDLSDQVGCLQDDVGQFRANNDRSNETTTATLARMESKLDNRTDSGFLWWVLPLIAIVLLVAVLPHSRQVNVHQTCSCPNGCKCSTPAPVVTDKDGKPVLMATIPAIPGTRYSIDAIPPAHTSRHDIQEFRVNRETAACIASIIDAIGRMPKPEKPADPAPAPPATPQA